ncbi:MAG: PEGA domain-containing protein, partial [Archangium sp.]|nr:PEGA domain-containing protein [Archangium sp.]
FAIGVCLYEMLTGERLFVGDSDFWVLEKVRKVEVLPPSHFNRKIPDALEKIVMKALAKDVDERYSYGSELGDDLRKFLYTSGYSFGRKDLAAFMKATFAEDVDKERARLQEYNDIKPPEGMLAAAEMGFGVGHVPSNPGMAVNASAVTAMPTMAPPSVAPAQSQMGLPQIVRPMPPTLAPQVSPTTVPMPARSPSLPRLTAAQAVHTVGKEEHEATVLADGLSDDATNPGQDSTKAIDVRNRPEVSDPATDPGRPVLQRGGMVPNMAGPDAMTQMGQGMSRPGPPVLMNDGLPPNAARRPTNGSQPLPPRMAAPMMVEGTGVSSPSLPALQPTGDTSPQLAAYNPSPSSAQLPQVGGSSNKTAFAILGAGVLVVATLIGLAVAFRPGPKGLLIIDVPSGASGAIRVSIDGKDLTEGDGSPIKDWPQVREVPAGKHMVMLKIPGYETLTETVTVVEGNEPSGLKGSPKKKSGE